MVIEEFTLRTILAVIIGALAAIIWSLRVMYTLERRVAVIEEHIDKIVHKILKEEKRKK